MTFTLDFRNQVKYWKLFRFSSEGLFWNLNYCETTFLCGFSICFSVMNMESILLVIHCNHSPLVLTIVATREAMTGQIMNMSQALKPLIGDIAKTIF